MCAIFCVHTVLCHSVQLTFLSVFMGNPLFKDILVLVLVSTIINVPKNENCPTHHHPFLRSRLSVRQLKDTIQLTLLQQSEYLRRFSLTFCEKVTLFLFYFLFCHVFFCFARLFVTVIQRFGRTRSYRRQGCSNMSRRLSPR